MYDFFYFLFSFVTCLNNYFSRQNISLKYLLCTFWIESRLAISILKFWLIFNSENPGIFWLNLLCNLSNPIYINMRKRKESKNDCNAVILIKILRWRCQFFLWVSSMESFTLLITSVRPKQVFMAEFWLPF